MKQLIQFVLISLVGAVVAGCASTPAQFYTLNATAKADGAPSVICSVIINPVIVPEAVSQPQFVITTGPNSVEVEEFNRWDAPLDDAIARVVSADLVTLMGTPRVSSAPIADFGPVYQVTIRVERFESIRAEGTQNASALVDAIWTVSNPDGQTVGSGRTTAN